MGYTQETTTEESVAEISVRSANLASYIVVSKFVSFIIAGLAFVIIVRFLGPTTYGIYVLATAVAGVFGSVGDLGVSTAFNKFMAENRLNKRRVLEEILASGFTILFIAGIILTAIAIIVSSFLASSVYHNQSFAAPFYLISFSIMVSMLFGAGYSALIGLGKGTNAALPVIIEAVFQYGISIGLVMLGFGVFAPILGLIFGLFIGFVTCMLIIYVKNRIGLVRPSISGMKRIFKFGLPIVVSNVLGTVVNSVAILVLGLFVVAAVIGNIGIAQNANALFSLVTVSISISLIQLFSTVLKSNKAKHKIGGFFSNSVYYAFVFVAPLIFFVAILAKPFSYVAFGGVYDLAPLYIRFTSLGLLIGLAGAYATSLIISTGNTKQVLKYNAIIVAIQLLLVFALIPILKGMGFILTFFVITPLLVDILFVSYVIRTLKVRLNFGRLFRVIAANILGTLPLYLLVVVFGGNYIPLLIAGVITTMLAYPLALSALKGIERKDMENLRKFSSGIPFVSGVLRVLLDYATLLL